MVNIAWIKDWGTVDLFVLPYFRERIYPGERGRLRTFPYIDTDQAIFQSSKKQKHIDYAIRWSNVVGNWDVGASYFYGTTRVPRLNFDTLMV